MFRTIAKLGVRLIVIIAIIFGGIRLASYFKSHKIHAEKRTHLDEKSVTAEVIHSSFQSFEVKIKGRGIVIPAHQITLRTQVSGKITALHPQWIQGGKVQKGEVILQIERRDYDLAVIEAKASLQQAQAQLELEQGRAEIAQKEWALFSKNLTQKPESNALATREPQIASAKSAIQAAKARLAKARLNLQRTTLKAPWNAMLLDEQVEVGDYISPSMPVGTLVQTDLFWVKVSIPVDRLPWIAIETRDGQGSEVVVTQDIGEAQVQRKGVVKRLLADLDPAGKMARLIVEIPNPLEIQSPEDLPLLLNAYVDVQINAQKPLQGVAIPNNALRDGHLVYLVDDEQRLVFREVHIAWRRDRDIIIQDGLKGGERIVISKIPMPVPGLKLKVKEASHEE